jgi:hypothetical protein
VIEIIKAAVLSLAAMGVICYIAYKATDYAPGDLTKAANEIVKAKNEIADLEKQLRQIDGNALITDWANRITQTARDAAIDSEKMVNLASKYQNKLVYTYHGKEVSWEEAKLHNLDDSSPWLLPVSSYGTHDKKGTCRCAYCDTLNDHETGVCDRCGAPLP